MLFQNKLRFSVIQHIVRKQNTVNLSRLKSSKIETNIAKNCSKYLFYYLVAESARVNELKHGEGLWAESLSHSQNQSFSVPCGWVSAYGGRQTWRESLGWSTVPCQYQSEAAPPVPQSWEEPKVMSIRTGTGTDNLSTIKRKFRSTNEMFDSHRFAH